MNPEESSLVDLALLGQLLQEHRERLLAMLRRRISPMLASRVGPEDILSEAFLQARKKWPKFRREPNAKPYPWLYRITLDCLIEAWRKESREKHGLDQEMPWPEESSLQLGLGLMQPGTTPTGAAARKEEAERVQAVLQLLRPKDREILRMRHEDELSHEEIGDVLGITKETAAVRYVRALQRLRDLWEQLSPESEP